MEHTCDCCEMLGKVTETDRGFQLIEFLDVNGQQCSLQQSSAMNCTEGGKKNPGSSFIWLGVGNCRMHLSWRQAKELRKRLREWISAGEFREGP